jgi:hypothetical protein
MREHYFVFIQTNKALTKHSYSMGYIRVIGVTRVTRVSRVGRVNRVD